MAESPHGDWPKQGFLCVLSFVQLKQTCSLELDDGLWRFQRYFRCLWEIKALFKVYFSV
jgi:hypothetical protein